VDDFRPDLPWFGLVALSRGLLLFFPSVLAANSPELQLLMLLGANFNPNIYEQDFF